MDGSAPASSQRILFAERQPQGRRGPDPLALILGRTERWSLFSVCIAVGLALHVGMIAFGIAAAWLRDIRLALEETRPQLHDYLWRTYDIEIPKPKDEPPPPPPPPPPAPEPAPVPRAMARPVDDPYKDVAPTPAKATKILTADPKPDDEPVNFDKIVSGEGNAVGGMQSGEGKGDRVTLSQHASHEGVPGGRGSVAAPPPPPPGPDLSRAVQLAGGGSWSCPFPPEADADQQDFAVVGVQVVVRADGTASSVTVTSDPGHGFGRAARQCALARRYQPALDRTGQPVLQTAQINVRFNR